MDRQHHHFLNVMWIFMLTLLYTSVFASSNFLITPYGTQPTLVNNGGTVFAYYTLTNNTETTRNDYTIHGLPDTVTQTLTNPSITSCRKSITLEAGASCQLELAISGEAVTNFALCKGSSCTTAAVPLNVNVNTSPATIVSAGFYGFNDANSGQYDFSYNWVERSPDNGQTWSSVVDSATFTTGGIASDYIATDLTVPEHI